MAHTDKPESANEAQDHSHPLDDGGFFSWLGGFSVTDHVPTPEVMANSSVDELWTRLFQFERDQ